MIKYLCVRGTDDCRRVVDGCWMYGKQSEVPKEGAYINGMISKVAVPVGGICLEKINFLLGP